MKQIFCKSLTEAICLIKQHRLTNPSAKIISADNPTKLCLGWCCTFTEQEWLIRLTDIKREPVPDDLAGSIFATKLRQLIITSSGRQTLAQYLNSELEIPEFDYVDRLINLKAFW